VEYNPLAQRGGGWVRQTRDEHCTAEQFHDDDEEEDEEVGMYKYGTANYTKFQ